MEASKTIVVGIDGAHFELIEPWLTEGKLDNIQSLISAGTSADSRSCLPPVTSPNWKCYSTGMNPGQLGIYWWENIDIDDRKVYYPADRKNRPDEIWDYLSRAGYDVGSIGTPLTYPPKDINGVMIAGGPDCASSQFTNPTSLEDKLQREYNYRVHPQTSITSDRAQAAEEIHDLISSRFEVALGLDAEYDFDFLQITTFYINVLQHHFWNDEETKQGWKIIDNYIGELRGQNPNANIILISDHGANKLNTVFNINTWLSDNSYLTLTWQYRLLSTLVDAGVNRKNIRSVTDKLRLTSLLQRILPDSAIGTVPFDTTEIKKEAKTDNVDWDRSKAIASGQGPIYAIDDDVTKKLKSALEKVEDTTGTRLFENVYRKDEIYYGEFLDEAPALILDQAPNVHIRGSIGRDEAFETPSETGWRAENKKTGLFAASGPDIDYQAPEQISIVDLAPTILSLFDVNHPSKFDGEVINIFTSDSNMAMRSEKDGL